MKKARIAIFASGSGTNAEAIITYFSRHPEIEVALVLSNNPSAFVLERAKKFDIPSKVFTREQFKEQEVVRQWLRDAGITHVALAGFLWLIPTYLIEMYPDRIINIHPALLPLFGGKGMYGMKVHEAVKAARLRETGITIHLVNAHYDEGKILFQGRCTVDDNSSPEEIARKVHELEYAHYPRIIEAWISGQL